MAYVMFVLPAMLLAMLAQWWIRSAYQQGMQTPGDYSGAQTARRILDQAGLFQVPVQETHGQLSDHYDPTERVVRLSTDVYHRRTLSAMGIAAHEVGHALQHAHGYLPLVVRNAAVPAATFGSSASMLLLVAGAMLSIPALIVLGLIAFSAIVVFQVINLPVEFDASARAKRILEEQGMVTPEEGRTIAKVLNAAALTYVAATLQSVGTLLYYISVYGGNRSSRDEA